MRKRAWLFVGLIGLLAGLLVGCGTPRTAREAAPAAEIMVFAGAGLKAPLQEIAQDFTNKHKCEVDFTFSDYKTLAEEIENGAKPDVLITSPEYMQVLKEKGVLDHYQELTAKVPVIVVAKTNPKAITSLEDLTKSDVKLALPDQDQSHLVGGCVGEEVLKKAKLSEKVHLIKPAPATVEGLLKAVTNGTADATIIWNDQAVRYDQKDITAIKLPQYGQKVMIALLREAPHREKAEEFFAFICSQEGKKLFKELGYGGK